MLSHHRERPPRTDRRGLSQPKALGGGFGRENGGKTQKRQALSPRRLAGFMVEAIEAFAMGRRLSKAQLKVIDRLTEDQLGEAIELVLTLTTT
jgi:hypothetical protein